MALLNIGASNRDDAFYRYKMPKMNTKIEGRGNGIKTNIVNMVEIAKALARPASYITKFFGCELGAQSKFDDKTGTSLVNGSHGTAKLAGLLEIFINKYVQCYGCKNPETEILITKTQMIEMKCAACGFISTVDMRDKLTTFILKNPPEAKKGTKDKKALRRAEKERLKEGETADEEKKKPKKEIKKFSSKDASSKKKPGGSDEDNNGSVPIMDSDNADDDDDDNDDDIQWQTDTSLEAARRQIQEQLNSVTADMVMLSTTEPKLVNEAKGLIQKGVEPNELLSSLLRIGSLQEAITALYEAIFYDTNKGYYAKEAVKKKNYLAAAAAAAAADEEGGLGSQMLLLQAMGDFCKKENGGAVKEVGLVLKALYDEDILEEKYIVKWYEETEEESTIWKNVKPFIEWLQNAESETEEE